jgi:WD40 repeat protein
MVSEASYVVTSVWDVPSGRSVRALGTELHHVSLSADGGIIAAAREQDVVLYSADTGELLHNCRGHSQPIRACQIAPSGAFVASGDGLREDSQPGPPADAILWDVKSGRLLHRLPGHYQTVRVLALSPDEQTLATVDGENVLRYWCVGTGKLLLTSRDLQNEWSAWGITHLIYGPDGESLYGCSAGTVQIVDAATGTLRRELADGALHIGDFCLSPDGKTLAIARGASFDHDSDEGAVELWDVASGELKTTLAAEHGAAMGVAFSPDGRTLASGHRNGTIALWHAATEEEVRRQAP